MAQQRQTIRSRLEAEHDRLLSVQASVLEGSALESSHQHPADVGTEMFEREKDLSILEHIQAEIGEVARAIRRLDAGTYGTCEDCGREIAPARLEARPAARYCIEDQARRERLASAS